MWCTRNGRSGIPNRNSPTSYQVTQPNPCQTRPVDGASSHRFPRFISSLISPPTFWALSSRRETDRLGPAIGSNLTHDSMTRRVDGWCVTAGSKRKDSRALESSPGRWTRWICLDESRCKPVSAAHSSEVFESRSACLVEDSTEADNFTLNDSRYGSFRRLSPLHSNRCA